MERERRRRKNKTVDVLAVSVHDVPDDLLKLILLRLDSPLWLVRAASTCKRWRGVISAGDGGGAFLRLARSLHPPAVVGHYREETYPYRTIAFVPTSPPAPIDGSRFSLDFLPIDKASGWEVADCHGGLVLLQKRFKSFEPPDFIVCDPLTRRHQGINRRTTQNWEDTSEFACAYLLNGKEEEDGNNAISISNFRVFVGFYEDPRTCVFSTADAGGGWRFLWRSEDDLDSKRDALFAGRVDGSLYFWTISGCVLQLLDDDADYNFAEVDLPSRVDMSCGCQSTYGIVESSQSPRRPRIVHVYRDGLEVFGWGIGGEWVLEHSIHRLSEATRGLPGYPEKKENWKVQVFAGGNEYVVFAVWEEGRRWLVSVDVETMEMAVVPDSSYHRTRGTIAYPLPWPSFIRE